MLVRVWSWAVVLVLSVTQALAGTCLMDQPTEALVEDLVTHASDQNRTQRKAIIRRAVLAEIAVPGTAESLLDVRAAIGKGEEKFDLLLPSVLRLAAGDWDGAIEAVPQSEDFDVAQTAKAVLPVTVEFSGDYARLLDLYPLGEGTYTQNLNMSAALRVALEAHKSKLAVDVSASHKFGYHSGEQYDRTMRSLMEQGEFVEAQRLSDVLRRGIEGFMAEGGLSLCLERRSLKKCRDDLLKRRDMARLERFDKGAFSSCFQLAGKEEETGVCFNQLRNRADAAEFESKSAVPRVFGITGFELWRIGGFAAAMGDPQPFEIPVRALREDGDFGVMRQHGLVLAALVYFGEQEAFDTYLDSVLTSRGPWTSEMMKSQWGDSWETRFEEYLESGIVDVLTWHKDEVKLNAMVTAPDVSEENRKAARRALLSIYRQSGRVDDTVGEAKELALEPPKLLAFAQAHKAAGEMAMADALEGLVRENVCDENVPLKQFQRRQLIDRLLMGRIVESGKAPKTLLFH